MLKIKIIIKKVIAAGSLVTLFSIYFGSSALAVAPPLSPGCYNNSSGDFTTTTCSTENQQRSIVAPYNKCFVINGSNGQQGGIINKEIACSTGILVAEPSSTAPDTEAECTDQGGIWKSVGNAGGVEYGFYCDITSNAGGGDGGDTAESDQTGGTRLESRPDDCTEETIDGSNCGIIRYLNIFMNLVSGIIAIAVIGNIIYAGIQYSTAQGDPGNVGKAKTRIRNALVAFLMYLSLFAFLQWLIPGGAF